MAEMIENTSVETGVETTQEQEVKTYTQEEVLALLQSETDKRVTAALKTQQKKYEKQLSLSKLDGDERAKAEKDNRIAELEEQLAQFHIERNRSELTLSQLMTTLRLLRLTLINLTSFSRLLLEQKLRSV